MKSSIQEGVVKATPVVHHQSVEGLIFPNVKYFSFNLQIVFSQLYDRLPEGEVPSVTKVMESFAAWYGQDEMEEVFGEDSEYDENRKVPRG